jgi:hypothetical protein
VFFAPDFPADCAVAKPGLSAEARPPPVRGFASDFVEFFFASTAGIPAGPPDHLVLSARFATSGFIGVVTFR